MGKLVAIGGGKNGRIKQDGTKDPYETKSIDEEIVRLTGKENPRFLFLSQAQSKPEYEKGYFETMQRIYGDIFGCDCFWISREDLKYLKSDELRNKVFEADIIYVGCGDTKTMIELWKKSGLDVILKDAFDSGIVISGLSAGANAWFKLCSSDSLKILLEDDTAPMIELECLGWFNIFLTPHYDDKKEFVNREDHMMECLENKLNMKGLGLSNCAAIEIIDDEFRIITSNDDGFAEMCYFDKNNNYIKEKIEKNTYFKLNKLISE